MKLVIDSLCEAMPAVSNVFGVLLALQAVFAILGMQLFMGTFAACTDPAVSEPEHCYGVFGVPSPMPFPPPSPSTKSASADETSDPTVSNEPSCTSCITPAFSSDSDAKFINPYQF